MKPKDLNLAQWQILLDKFKATHAEKDTPIAMRIEDTQFTIARHFGCCKYNGEYYLYFEPQIAGEAPNADGTPKVAWILVRDDFLSWATKQLRKKGALDK